MSTKADHIENMDNTCPVCHDVIEIFAIGPCDHPVCYRCSTRMRVLCEQMDCPICRSQMLQVAFVNRKSLFKDNSLRNCIPNSKYKIFFEDEDVEDRFLELLEYRCRMPSCKNRNSDRTFIQLQTHMRREHQLFACDLCVSHLKIFPFERKFYNRKNLATHRRVGDEDDKSYKGHPLCEFCDNRYNDRDELLKHLRKDHFFCHFCDQHGSNAYYDQYQDLMAHFSDCHFLCTEGECGNPSTRFTHAFASEIDLKAHRASAHNKNLSKAQSREVRTIELDFHLPRRRPGNNRSDDFEETRTAQGGRVRGSDRYNRRRDYDPDEADLQRAIEASKESANVEATPVIKERVPDPVTDFPALNGIVVPVNVPAAQKPASNPEDEFPSLSLSRNNKLQTQPPAKAYSSIMNCQVETKAPVPVIKESKPVSLGSVAKIYRELPSSAPRKTEEEYPALGGSSSIPLGLMSNASSVNWVKKTQNNSAPLNSSTEIRSVTNHKSKNSKHLDTLMKDEKEFPSLVISGQPKTSVVPPPAPPDWTKQNGSSGKKKTKEDKYDDPSFELPDSYHRTYEGPAPVEKTVNLVKVVDDAITVPAINQPARPAPFNNTQEFPGLPVRSQQNKTKAKEECKIKKKTKKEDKIKAKPSFDTNACLGDIALSLMQPEKGNDTVGGSLTNRKSETVSSKKASKLPDWFDNPTDTFESSKPAVASTEEEVCEIKHNASPLSVEECCNFPSLHTMSNSVQQPKSPPGFTSNPQPRKASLVTVPPGFENQSPSFEVQPPTLSSIPTPPPGFSSTSTYIQPADFRTRNLKLIEDIQEALVTTEDGFSNFKVLSGHFRQGLMNASSYYLNCQALLGNEDFIRVFPELLVLLPDISKQRELYEVHQASQGKKGSGVISQCEICGQIMIANDIQHHQLQHVNFSNFPLLSDSTNSKTTAGNGVAPGVQIKEAWIKAK